MEEPGASRRRGAAALALPGVEADVVVVAARGKEDCVLPVPLHHVEPEHAVVEREGALQIGDLEMDVADADLGLDRAVFQGGVLSDDMAGRV